MKKEELIDKLKKHGGSGIQLVKLVPALLEYLEGKPKKKEVED